MLNGFIFLKPVLLSTLIFTYSNASDSQLLHYQGLYSRSRVSILFCPRATNYYTTVRGPDILHNVIVSGRVTILPKQIFRNYIIFLLLAKCVRGPDEMTSRAGFGPRAVVWRPLL